MILRYAYLAGMRLRLKRFRFDARRARVFQHRTLLAKVRRNVRSEFGRDHGFSQIRTAADFRRQLHVATYDDHHPYIERVLHGEVEALFAPGTKVLMFAMTSGTTGQPKRLPITEELFREYKAGWRMWGAGVFGDHFNLITKKTLQLASDWQQYRAPCGIACGQISGLAATTRPRLSSHIFPLPAQLARIHDPAARHYASLRFGLETGRVGMIITANPSTLVEFGQRMNGERETLIRDIHDGTLSCEIPLELRQSLARRILKRRPDRARELEQAVAEHGALLPKFAWPKMDVLAVWTGGSVNVYLSQLPALYGNVAIRDHGLSASEGRMTIPLSDGTAAGLLDFYNHYFEFIPVEEQHSARPNILEGHELEVGKDYYILLTTSGGLYRYDIHDVVRCVGFEGQAPLVEFLNKGKNFCSLTGEKLSEHQVVRAVKAGFADLALPLETFALAPVMEDRPRYVLLVEPAAHRGRADDLSHRVQMYLERLNEEYASKCSSGRLLPLAVSEVAPGTWHALRAQKVGERGNLEEYKHACLVNDLEFVARLRTLTVSPQPARRMSAALTNCA
ncbi:MAG: GH3 auxin-responsive promoter family protein [Pirellulales bacterium]